MIRLSNFILVKANNDSVVIPKESEVSDGSRSKHGRTESPKRSTVPCSLLLENLKIVLVFIECNINFVDFEFWLNFSGLATTNRDRSKIFTSWKRATSTLRSMEILCPNHLITCWWLFIIIIVVVVVVVVIIIIIIIIITNINYRIICIPTLVVMK